MKIWTLLLKFRLQAVCDSLTNNDIERELNSIEYIVNLQKVIHTIQEIKNNGLIGKFEINEDSHLIFKVKFIFRNRLYKCYFRW